MAKKKKHQKQQSPQRTSRLPSRVTKELPHIYQLLQRKRWAEAFPLLAELDSRFPNNPALLAELVDVCYELQDIRHYLFYIQQLYKLTPNEPEILLGMGGAYLSNLYPIAALAYFRLFLQRFPNHERAAELHETVDMLEEGLPELLAHLAVEGAEGFELAYQHDLLRAALEYGDTRGAQQIGKQLLRQYPTFIPALNNMGQVEFQGGNYDLAIDYARRVLAQEADNFQASANLTRYYFLIGELDKAQAQADHLRGLTSDNPEIWVKKAEALTYLGDDQAVQEVVRAADQRKEIAQLPSAALLYHLGAVAELRLGNENAATTYWKRAIKLAPHMTIAKENLDDLKQPIGQRHAPWPFPAMQWLPDTFTRDLERLINRKQTAAISEQVADYFDAHPDLFHRLALLLERGDGAAREMVIEMAEFLHHPKFETCLEEYVFSQHGGDQSRVKALQMLTKNDIIEPGNVRLWIGGEWQEILNVGFEVGDESDVDHPITNPQVSKWLEEGTRLLLRENRVDEAQQLFIQADALEPNVPSIRNNLALSYERQGDHTKAQAMIEQIFEAHPDYLFARTGVAVGYINQGEFDKAFELLLPLLSRRKLHASEFASLADTYIRLYLAKNEEASALKWFGMWKDFDPSNPRILRWQGILATRQTTKNPVKRLFSSLAQKLRQRFQSAAPPQSGQQSSP